MGKKMSLFSRQVAPMNNKQVVDIAWAEKASISALCARGLSYSQAQEVVDVLLETSLLGVETHGLRLLATYLDEIDRGVSNPRPEFKVIQDRGATVFIDADRSLGVLAGLHAVSLATSRAKKHGVAVVGVRNSNHYGAAGAYTRRIARNGLLGISTTSAASRVAPFFGRDPLFGTNPISIAFGDDFCLDMATSQVCFSEIKERSRAGSPLEPSWAINETGRSVDNPAEMHALCPLGGYKGQGLAMAVTLLTSVLTGGKFDWQMEHMNMSTDGVGRGVSHCLIAIDAEAFGGHDSASKRCSELLNTVRAALPAEPAQSVLVPGDPQRAHKARQESFGLDLDEATYEILKEFA